MAKEIHFSAITLRKFKTLEDFHEFCTYLKDHVPGNIMADLNARGMAEQHNLEQDGRSEAHTKWIVSEIDVPDKVAKKLPKSCQKVAKKVEPCGP